MLLIIPPRNKMQFWKQYSGAFDVTCSTVQDKIVDNDTTIKV